MSDSDFYDMRLLSLIEHVEKGNEDGLYTSSVASCTNLWALVMDARIRFIAQVHELSHVFTVLKCMWIYLEIYLKSGACGLSEVTTGGRSGGSYNGSSQARAVTCYDRTFGYESLSYDRALTSHDPSHLSRYSSSANSSAGYVTL
uniref:DUF7477 domain-containing protein n=1 Tax=Physcomitrium patens TaxID=3218 RepID=A0A2K1JSU8_PHYPA|nr:hypothetical protein PHYPA_014387 [Physcomitrium patens]